MSNTTKSIYDKVETAKDLIFEVAAHGLSTKQEDICRAQDIFILILLSWVFGQYPRAVYLS